MHPITSRRRSLPIVAVAFALAACDRTATVQVDASTRFQTFDAWSATVEIGDSDMSQSRIAGFREEILDWAVDSIGITRLRLAVKSGYENRVDHAPAFLADNSRRGPWVASWFTIENDNDDPYLADPAGFQFFFIDHLMETVVLPIRDRLEARGETLYLNLNYVDFGSTPFEHRDAPEEFAEFMLEVVRHLDTKYGIVADGIEILEPDNDGEWSARHVAEGFVAVGERLEAAGYDLDFIGPSNITVAGAIDYIEEMLTVPGLDRYLTELSYHKYRGYEPEQLQEISRIARENGLRTSMLEFMDATTADLYRDLVFGDVSVWQRFAILDYVRPDEAGRVRYWDDVRQTSLYTRSVRPGSVRVAATSSAEDFQPVAFVAPDGGQVVITRAERARRFAVRGLDAGGYEAVAVFDDGYESAAIPLVEDETGALTGEMVRPGVLLLRPASAP